VRILLLAGLIGVMFYVNQVWYLLRLHFSYHSYSYAQPESFVNQQKSFYAAGKLNQAIKAYKDAIYSDPGMRELCALARCRSSPAAMMKQ